MSVFSGSNGNPRANTSPTRQPKGPKGARRDGDSKVGDRPESRGFGPEGALVGAGLPRGPDRRVHEAHVLGAHVGRYGAHLLLRHFHVLHGRLYLFP